MFGGNRNHVTLWLKYRLFSVTGTVGWGRDIPWKKYSAWVDVCDPVFLLYGSNNFATSAALVTFTYLLKGMPYEVTSSSFAPPYPRTPRRYRNWFYYYYYYYLAEV